MGKIINPKSGELFLLPSLDYVETMQLTVILFVPPGDMIVIMENHNF